MKKIFAAAIVASVALVAVASPASAKHSQPKKTSVPVAAVVVPPAPTQSISAVCDTGTVTMKNYPPNSKVIVRKKAYRGNFETYNTVTVFPFEGDKTVIVKVPGYFYPQRTWIISVEFWPGNANGFTWGQPFSHCV